jgi:hypothetical protein
MATKASKTPAELFANMDGFEIVTERKPTGGVTVSSMPPALIKQLEIHVPKALADSGYEPILRMPVIVDTSSVPKITDRSTDAEKAYAHKALEDAKAEAMDNATVGVRLLTSYATAWGKAQTPKLYIAKVANRRDMPSNHARLSVRLDEDVPPENRPGRK